jgi:GDPmannose 4,6-dehydratase
MACLLAGILFNHESPLRGPEFGRKDAGANKGRIAAMPSWEKMRNAVEVSLDYVWPCAMLRADKLELRNSNGHHELGWVFCNLVAHALDMRPQEWHTAQWQGNTIIRTSSHLYRPAEVEQLCGDATLARTTLGWTPKVSLPALAHMMAIDGTDS